MKLVLLAFIVACLTLSPIIIALAQSNKTTLNNTCKIGTTIDIEDQRYVCQPKYVPLCVTGQLADLARHQRAEGTARDKEIDPICPTTK